MPLARASSTSPRASPAALHELPSTTPCTPLRRLLGQVAGDGLSLVWSTALTHPTSVDTPLPLLDNRVWSATVTTVATPTPVPRSPLNGRAGTAPARARPAPPRPAPRPKTPCKHTYGSASMRGRT